MAIICGYIIPDGCIFMALALCLATSVVFSSTKLMQAKFDEIMDMDIENKEMENDENEVVGETTYRSVYHSEEVFRLNYAEMDKKFKIFIYPPGKECSKFEATLVGKYASEGYFFKNIRESKFSTIDPDQAHLFFVPLSLQKLHHQESSYKRVGKKAEKCVDSLIQKYPYWNRTLGTDHFFLNCLDHDVHIPSLVKNTIRVVCSSKYDSDVSRFIPHKDIILPSVMQSFIKPPASQGNDMHHRQVLAFWAGVCNTDVRKKLVQIWGGDRQLNIQNTTVNNVHGRMVNMYRSKFCICPVGVRITNTRIMLAIHHGCVPVIIDDYLDLPFNDILVWEQFSVVLRERDVNVLKGVLSIVANMDDDDDYTRMHVNLMRVQKHFEWNTPPIKYDAFHMVMYDLWLRRHLIKY